MEGAADTAVIGGGLAGLSAAITLAQAGHRVVLLEAKSYPHHKVCGEFLSPMCAEHLKRLGVADGVYARQPARIRSVIVTADRGKCWETDLPGTGLGLSRYTLDALLVESARALGVLVQEKTTVYAIQGDLDHGFTLTTRTDGEERQLQARTVIGAFGKRSSIDRVLQRSSPQGQSSFMGHKAHFYGPALMQRVELHAFPGGYCGLSEIEDGRTNVCLLVRQPVFQSVGRDIPTFIQWMRHKNRRLDEWFVRAEHAHEGWESISQIPFARKTLVDEDVVMTGDAAGVIAPLAGDGMEMALHGGQMAAAAVHRFLIGEWSAFSLRRNYPLQWRQTFGARLRLARWVQMAMLRPELMSLGLHMLHHIPSVGRLIVHHTRDSRLMLNGGERY